MSDRLGQPKNKALRLSVMGSVLAHLALIFPAANFAGYHFAPAVQPLKVVMVDLASRKIDPSPGTIAPRASQPDKAATTVPEQSTPPMPEATTSAPIAQPDAQSSPSTVSAKPESSAPTAAAPVHIESAGVPVAAPPNQAPPPPLRSAREFADKRWEQLTYRVSMLGLPVGEAVLQAKSDRGELTLSLSVKSRPPFSGIYPVDDLIETRHAAGNFIITKIRQREGDFRSNRGFTLFLRDKKVFWMDLLTQRSLNETVPNSDVLDLLSALYYLRNRPLKVGGTEKLHVYDSDVYTELPVGVLRKELIDLPGLKSVRTLVVKPLLSTGGIFKRTGDVMIWLTDDTYKAPVRVQTEIALGTVTADLVSAESKDEATETGKTAGIKKTAATKLESRAVSAGD